MPKFKVTFLPDNKTVEVESGTTLLKAAEQADVYINSLCGGEGLCGECRLQVLKGKARADKHAIGFFSGEEIKNGFVLGCQTKVDDDMEVMVPHRSRLEMEKIITEGTTVTYSEPARVNGGEAAPSAVTPEVSLHPLVTTHFLKLPEPTLTDNVSDIDRVTRELSKLLPYPHFEISLPCLRNLAETLRTSKWQVTATVARHYNSGQVLKIEAGNTAGRNYGLAIDVGTTTVVVALVDLNTGKVLGVEGNHNLQARYGADVISRIVFACGRGSLDQLREAVITNINLLTKVLIKEAGIDVTDINAAVAAGNTTMSHFLLSIQPCHIRLEPYVPAASIYPQIQAKEIGIEINPNGILETLPSVSSYVGGDIVGGVLACGLADRPEISCLIDVGTNGEIVVGNQEWLVCCSASAGPAFEGGGVKYGMRATKGAIEKVLIKNDEVTYHTIGDGKPRGICGSGLIDSIYELVRNHIIGRDGKFNFRADNKRYVMREDGPAFVLAFAEETENGEAITFGENDINNLIKSKGAVFAAIKSLLDYIGLKFTDLTQIYLAGGFGSSLNIEKAIAIGLLPDIEPAKIKFIGNSSITGARLALLSGEAYDRALNIARKMTNIELSNHAPFMNEFIAALFLPHTDLRLFPSVKY